MAKTFGQGPGLWFRLDLQFVHQHGPAGGIGAQGPNAVSLGETQSHQASVAFFMESIEAQPAAHGIDGPLHISHLFVVL